MEQSSPKSGLLLGKRTSEGNGANPYSGMLQTELAQQSTTKILLNDRVVVQLGLQPCWRLKTW